MSNVHSLHPRELLKMQRKTKGLNKAGKSESWFRLLATKLIKDSLNSHLCKWKTETLLWTHPSRYICLIAALWSRHSWNQIFLHELCTTAEQRDHSECDSSYKRKLKAPLALCIFWEASIPELGGRHMVRGYFNYERCSHKAYSASYFNNGTDSLICVLVALSHRLPSPLT